MHPAVARQTGLIDAIDRRLHLLKIHLPYHESDHVLNLAYNALCEGTCLQDLELRRQDEVYLDALGTQRIPDPTTAGDFCRRFRAEDVHTLLDIINEVRQRVWARQSASFFDEARIDMDGVLVETTGECKIGMDMAYDGTWGYHPLVVSLANTSEVLSVLNRPGNRPSTKERRPRWTGLCVSAWREVFAGCCCVATPILARRNTWIAGQPIHACVSFSAWIARRRSIIWLMICRPRRGSRPASATLPGENRTTRPTGTGQGGTGRARTRVQEYLFAK